MNSLFNEILNKIDIDNLPKYQLYQTDFDQGTYCIEKPGCYTLKENIIFDPDQEFPPTKYMKKNPQYWLGWFAAITICTSNVVLDLNGFEIKQSKNFYIRQRFFMTVEIANSPFIPGEGPVSYGGLSTNNFISGNNIMIRNGTFGLTSHTGIHGNDNDYIILENLNFIDFEFSAIAMNNADHLIITECDIGPNYDKVYLNGNYSVANLINKVLNRLLTELHEKITSDEIKKINELNTNLDKLTEETTNLYLVGKYNKINKLFRNKYGHADCGIVNGIQLTTKGQSTGEFTCCPAKTFNNTNPLSHDIYLNKVKIHDLKLFCQEVCYIKHNESKCVGAFGELIRILDLYDFDNDEMLEMDILNQTEIYLGFLIKKYPKLKKILRVTTNIPPKLIRSCMTGVSNTEFFNNNTYYFGADMMGHVVKGLMGLRLDGCYKVNINNVHICN